MIQRRMCVKSVYIYFCYVAESRLVLSLPIRRQRQSCIRDRLGCVLLFGATTLVMSFVDTVEALFVLRFAAGIGMGGALPNAAALAAEWTPPRYRVVAVTITIVCIPLGGVVGGALAAEVLPAQGWRAMMQWAGALPLALLLFLWRGLPDDPPRDAAPATASGVVVGQIRALLSQDRRRDTLALWCAFGFCLMAIYASFSWLPTMLVETGRDIAEASRGLMYFNLGGVITALGSYTHLTLPTNREV